jgi:hypothetical protein
MYGWKMRQKVLSVIDALVREKAMPVKTGLKTVPHVQESSI